MNNPKLTICQKQLSEREWYDKQTKETQKSFKQHTKKHKFYKGQDGYNYCETCKEKGSGNQFLRNKPEEYWRLEEIQIRQFENDEYEVKMVKPIRQNQKVTDEALLEKFEKLKGKYVEVSKLKIILGKSHDNPEGFIKVNEPSGDSKMTTVISSTYLTRLSRITGKVWHQKRAIGENGTLLVKFTEGPETYAPQTKKSKIDYAAKILQTREALDSQYARLYDSYGTDQDFEEEEGRLKELENILEEAESLLQERGEQD